MNIEELREYCLSKKGTEECFPFDKTTLVFKVAGKMFALTDLDDQPLTINLKCAREVIEEVRVQYPCVTPGYHMNKKHWNTVIIDGSVSDKQIYRWIDDSYNLVINSLSNKLKRDM
ncbi:MAG: MmcQ/YjbR family DNA-binding protein [Bacteroidota bacterium]